MNKQENFVNEQSQPIRKESYANKETKFTDYLDKKVKNIQQMKSKTIKTCEKYFQDLKQKTEKYLVKQQKRIINSFQDNINMSLNCVTHNFLYNFDNISGRKNVNENSPKTSKLESGNEQKVKIKIIDNQNQLSIKLQMKKIFQQIVIAQNHLNEKLKLIGDDLKKQIQKLVEPLRDLLSKISKFTLIDENISTLVISENKIEEGKKKMMNNKKLKKDDIINAKNPEIYAQKKRIGQLSQKQENFHSQMTDKLLKKSNIKHQVLFEVKQKSFLLELKPIADKQDNIVTSINKMTKYAKLLTFDTINKKSLLHIYQKTPNQIQAKEEQNINRQGMQINNNQQNKPVIEIYLNDKKLKLQDNESSWVYERYTKIAFESKPDREYLFILSSKLEGNQQHQQQQTRQLKTYQFSIFNYKGDLIIKQQLQAFKLPQQEKIIEILQISLLKEYIYLIFNNHLIRLNLKNIKSRKVKLNGTDSKITNAITQGNNLVLFDARNKVVEFMNADFILLQKFSWITYYPDEVRLNKLINLKVHLSQSSMHEANQPLHQHPHKEITLLLPNLRTDSFHYLENGFQKNLLLTEGQKSKHSKKTTPKLQFIQSIFSIDHEIYVILSNNPNAVKPKTNVFLLQLTHGDQQNSLQKSLKGKVTYLDTVYEDVLQCKFIKNQLYFQLKSGKVNSFCIY